MPEPVPNTQTMTVAIALIERDGRYLITKRLPDDSFGGFWEFPGGKLDPGEDLESCLAREILEELGIEVKVGPVIQIVEHRYPSRLLKFHCFACSIERGEPRPIECSELRWVTPAELADFEFPPASGPIIEGLQKNKVDRSA